MCMFSNNMHINNNNNNKSQISIRALNPNSPTKVIEISLS